MPKSHLSTKGSAVKGQFTKRYGARGASVFYATMNARKNTKGGRKMIAKLTKKGAAVRKRSR